VENISGKQFGPYRIVEPLGEGGMAAVYKAYQPGIDRYVAVKVLPEHLAKDPQFLARFDREARVLAKLQHPHILPIHDYGQSDSYTYIVMPLVKSGTMTDILKGEVLPLPQIQKMITQIGDALDYAHGQGVVHRDIKPSNVLIDERGNCMLTDFGIAKLVESEADLTGTGGIIGTPSYMSPEQAKGQKLDGRSDIYSLGIILYEMAVGRVPFKAETPLAVIVKHLHDPLPLPRTLNPNLPESVERVILKSLAKEPEDRYPTAEAMVDALNAAINEAPANPPVAVPSATMASAGSGSGGHTVKVTAPPAASSAPSSPMPWLLVAGGAGVIGLAILIGLALWAMRPAPPTPVAPTVVAVSTPAPEPAVVQAVDTPTLTPTLPPPPSPVAPPANKSADTLLRPDTPVPPPPPADTPVQSDNYAAAPPPPVDAGPPPAGQSGPPPGPPPQSVFPLPEDVQNFSGTLKTEAINYQTNISLDEILQFYRTEFAAMGLVERDITTTVSDQMFSVVWDGWADGKSVVVQSLDLGYSSTEDKRNVNIRLETLY
jgi:hypothetical protein